MKEKGLIAVLKALPGLLLMEQTRGLLMTLVKQWGIKNTIFILLNIVRKTGLIESITSLIKFRLDKLMSNLLISMWDIFGEREAIISEDRRFTYKEFKERVFRLANGLQNLGLKPRDKFAVMVYNGNEFFESILAGSLIGCTLPLLNWHMREDELIEAINRTNPKALIFDDEFMERVISIKDQLKTVEHFIVVRGKASEGMLSYEELISRSPAKMPKTEFILAFTPYTAGTTGVPKSVNLADGFSYAMSKIAEAPRVPFGAYLKYFVMQLGGLYYFYYNCKDKKTRNARCLAVTPLYHAGSLASWLPLLFFGGTQVPMRKFDPEGFLRLIEKERINSVFVAPTILERILALPDRVKTKYNLSSMRSLICAAAPCPPEVKKSINKFFMQQGCEKEVFVEYYGSAETSATTVLIPKDYIEKPKRIASVGKPRCGITKIFDDEKREWCPPNKEGRILTITAPSVSLRYAGTPEKLESAFKVVDGVSWFDDGLFGYLDEDDFLYLTTREKEMIISGGVNIYPIEIEEAIKRNPKVFDVGVIRAPDKNLGEVPVAIIHLKEGEKSSEQEIIEHCKKEGLYGFKIPRIVEFIEQLPRHIDGKLIKRDLEEKYWKGIERRG